MLVLYVVGFFFLTPVMLSANYTNKGTFQKVHEFLYHRPISTLKQDNWLRQRWGDLQHYWCEKDAECEVVD